MFGEDERDGVLLHPKFWPAVIHRVPHEIRSDIDADPPVGSFGIGVYEDGRIFVEMTQGQGGGVVWEENEVPADQAVLQVVLRAVGVRRFGPVSSFNLDDVKMIVHAITGGYSVIPFGFGSRPTSPISYGISKPHYGPPKNRTFPDWAWSDSRDPDEYRLDEASRQVVLAAVDLAGPGVRYDEETDEVVDERSGDGYDLDLSDPIRTGISFVVTLRDGDEVVESVTAWARKDQHHWCWGVDMAGLHGQAEDEADARRRAVDAVRSWWITVGPKMKEEDQSS